MTVINMCRRAVKHLFYARWELCTYNDGNIFCVILGVRVIRSCLNHLEQLDPEIVPAVVACKDLDNRAAMEHLRLLKNEWQENMQLLLVAIDRIIDQRSFLVITGQWKYCTEICVREKYVRHVDMGVRRKNAGGGAKM